MKTLTLVAATVLLMGLEPQLYCFCSRACGDEGSDHPLFQQLRSGRI